MTKSRFIVTGANAGGSLLDCLAQRMDVSRRKAKELIDGRGVFVNGRRVWMARHTLRAGDQVEMHAAPVQKASAPAPVVFEDDEYLIVNKPPGVICNGPESVEEGLRTQRGNAWLAAVHRLDRDTSGCLIFAKTPAARDRILALWNTHAITKLYHAVVLGRVPKREHTIDRPVDGLSAVTHFRVLDANDLASHLLVKIDTGRTHQIRRHMEALGYPVLGDRAYGGGVALPPQFRGISRQMLHAGGLRFEHPATGKPVRVDIPMPGDFHSCLSALRLS